MAEFHSTKSARRIGRHRALIAAMGVILVGGAAFAAVGGVEAVKRIFVNVTIRFTGPDGETYQYVTLQPFEIEDGKATANLNIGEGQEATMVIEQTEGADPFAEPGGVQSVMVTTTMLGVCGSPVFEGGTGTEQSIEVSIGAGPGDNATAPESLLDSVTEPEVVVPWVDANGEAMELYLVRSTVGDTPVFKVLSARWSETGEMMSEVIGVLSEGVTEGAEVAAATVDENGLVTVTLISEDGQEKRVAFSADPNRVNIRAKAIHVTTGDPTATEDE